MILTLLLVLGPLIGLVLVLNSPEEVIPGKPYFIHAARISFFLAESIFLFIILLPTDNLTKALVIFIPMVFGYALSFLKEHLLAHTIIVFGMVSYVGSLSLTLATCAILGSAFVFASKCDGFIREEKVPAIWPVLKQLRLFILPLLVSIVFVL